MEINLEDIDRDLLADRLAELKESGVDDGEEYDTLCWFRDLLYLLDEGFITALGDGRYCVLDTKCPNNL